MNATLHAKTSIGAAGYYETKVIEHPILKTLRRLAGRLIGLYPGYLGTVAEYHRLSSHERLLHDEKLVPMVEKYRFMIESNIVAKNVFDLREDHNLILDQGLDKVLTQSSWADSFDACCVGTGTVPTEIDSGAITGLVSGTTVTSSGTFFLSTMEDYVIKFDSGEEAYIDTVTSTTTATLDRTLSIGSGTLFTVYAVNQTGLYNEIKRTSTYLTGAGNCGTSGTNGGTTVVMQRTYDFSTEVSNQNYTELAWSSTTSPGQNIFSRTLITGGAVTVLIGQQLRVVYSLYVSLGPSAAVPGTFNIPGWPVSPSTSTDGYYMMCNPTPNPGGTSTVVGGVNSFGSSNFGGDLNIGSGPVNPTIYLCTGSTLPPFGNTFIVGTSLNADVSNLKMPYVIGSFYREVQAIFGPNIANATNWRAITISDGGGFAFVFNQNQTKDNLHRLTLSVGIQVGRILTNS